MSTNPAPLRAGDLLDDEPPRRNYWGYLLLLVPVLLVLALVVTGVVGDPFLSGQPGGLKVGELAPQFQATGWINGDAPTEEDLRGKVLVVDAWATWCEPCREETPRLVAMHKRYREQGVVFIGLTGEPERALPNIHRFLEHFGVTWLIGYGAVETLEIFEADVIPMVWVIGPDGRVVWNGSSRESLEQGIKKALAQLK